ncbi:MAG: AAC(3) family N-acetyltransferase [Desulfovibrionaceae bacterium]
MGGALASLVTAQGLRSALREAGVGRGDMVMVQSALPTLGAVEGAPQGDAYPAFFHAAFREVLGEEGTLCVLTSSEDYARHGVPFHLESTPSQSGMFSEYVRGLPRVVRSAHPITSITAEGPAAQAVCGGAHHEGYGWDSPWGRLHRADAWMLSLGLGLARGMAFLHYIEALYGVPYLYVRVYDTPVHAAGAEAPGPFTMHVRFLDFEVQQEYAAFERHLVATGAAREVRVGRGRLQAVRSSVAFDEGIRWLRRDRYGFLAAPPAFRKGEVPF